MIFSTIDPFYIQILSGIIISLASVVIINSIFIKKNIMLSPLLSGFQMFEANPSQSNGPNIKLV